MNTPINCVGIILDGNRRWAKAKGLPQLEGHRAGSKALQETVRLMKTRGVRHLIVYVFSTENWDRDKDEVAYLLELFREYVGRAMKELAGEGVRIRFVGQRERFSLDLQEAMREVEKESAKNTDITLWVCLSYGGRAEIAAAASAAAKEGGDITEEVLGRYLWTSEMPDPDLIIRTGGEKRLSNFLPWQSVYSELFFIDTFWPDFSGKDFDAIVSEFALRERRHGR